MTRKELICALQIQSIITEIYQINQNFNEVSTAKDYENLNTKEVDLLALLVDQCAILCTCASSERNVDLELGYKPTDGSILDLYNKYGFMR